MKNKTVFERDNYPKIMKTDSNVSKSQRSSRMLTMREKKLRQMQPPATLNVPSSILPQYVKGSHLWQYRMGVSNVYSPSSVLQTPPVVGIPTITTTLPQCAKDSHPRQVKGGLVVYPLSYALPTTLPQCVKGSYLQHDKGKSNVYSHHKPTLQTQHFQPVGNPANVFFGYPHRPLAHLQKQARFLRMKIIREKRTRSKFPRFSRTEPSPQMNDLSPSNVANSQTSGAENGGSQQLCDSHFPTVKRGVQFSWPAFWGFPVPSTSKGRTSSEKFVKGDSKESKGVYVGVEDDTAMEDKPDVDNEDDEVADIWKEMDFAMECCKEISEGQVSDKHDSKEDDDDDDCDHSFILKDDLGYVCRVCGLVQKEIQEVFEFLYPKRTRTKAYRKEPMNNEVYRPEKALPDWCKLPRMDLDVTEVLAHPRHLKHMKRHQIEGFNFLTRNLVTENPHGCILAHAPGSGKTFMIICFMQSFLAKYPTARPLVILPKGILRTWKKEFQKWQIEEIPLYDFYSVKAINRTQQLAVLKQWVEQKSILFLGYKQFSTIVTADATSTEMASCQEILVRVPTVLIMDEGHTPRNQETNALESLTRVQTPRKVVLSGTLYQNHVKEVFNILNLVQPRFLKIDVNREIVGRIMSKVEIFGVRKQLRVAGDSAFYDLIESTLLKDENNQRKVGIIKDLREMTRNVLHYYRGDSFDELPGLEDLTVLLNLSPKQKAEVDEFTKSKERKFKSSSLGSAIYLHPELKQFSGSRNDVNDENIDKILEKMNHRDGVKVMFFLNILRLCEISKEKLLVFSHYILPLKFLERLAMHVKGWTHGKEIYKITGESTTEHREWSMERFNSSSDARVFFGSVKACGEGISLVGASRILILDVHPNPSVSWQAVCRAFRPGQLKKVYTYRLVAADSPEEEDHSTCFKKELIAKMWFEWDGNSNRNDFESEAIGVDDCGDEFLQNPSLGKDIKALYKR